MKVIEKKVNNKFIYDNKISVVILLGMLDSNFLSKSQIRRKIISSNIKINGKKMGIQDEVEVGKEIEIEYGDRKFLVRVVRDG